MKKFWQVFHWNFGFRAVRRSENLVDLEKSEKMRLLSVRLSRHALLLYSLRVAEFARLPGPPIFLVHHPFFFFYISLATSLGCVEKIINILKHWKKKYKIFYSIKMQLLGWSFGGEDVYWPSYLPFSFSVRGNFLLFILSGWSKRALIARGSQRVFLEGDCCVLSLSLS